MPESQTLQLQSNVMHLKASRLIKSLSALVLRHTHKKGIQILLSWLM